MPTHTPNQHDEHSEGRCPGRKIILHLCADTGSDTKPFQDDPNYEVILVGSKIGVENFTSPDAQKRYEANLAEESKFSEGVGKGLLIAGGREA